MLPTHDNAIAVGSGQTTAAGTMKTRPGTPTCWSAHMASTNTTGPSAPRSVKNSSTRSPSLTKSHPPNRMKTAAATATTAKMTQRLRTACSVPRPTDGEKDGSRFRARKRPPDDTGRRIPHVVDRAER